MKIFAQIVIAVGLLLWVAMASLDMAGRYLIQDTIELHGTRLLGSDVRFKSYAINWKERDVLLGGLCVPKDKHDFFCIDSVLLKFKNDFMPDFKRDGLAPDVLAVDTIEIRNLVFFYAIDNDAAEEELLRFRGVFSAMADEAMKKRLHSEDGGELPFLKFRIDKFVANGIKIDVSGKGSPETPRFFPVDEVSLSDVGGAEGGVAAVEVLDRITQAVFENVQYASKQVEAMRPPKSKELSHSQSSKKENDQNKSDGVGEGIREIGTDIKNTGQKIWKSTKNLFN